MNEMSYDHACNLRFTAWLEIGVAAHVVDKEIENTKEEKNMKP